MAETKNTRPAFDTSALSFEETEAPKTERQRIAKDNPFTPLLAATFEARREGNGATGRSVVVPNANVGKVKYMIRAGADELGIGSALKVTPEGKANSRVTFAGKPRKARKQTDADSANA